MSVPVVALIGRPNVGKSALFNRIVGDDSAIVSRRGGHDARPPLRAGRVERARRSGSWTPAECPTIRTRRWTSRSVGRWTRRSSEADLLLLRRRREGRPASERLITSPRCCANRGSRGCSSPTRSTIRASTDFYEFYQLGAGDPFPVSAQNGKNSGDLLDALVERLPESAPEDEEALRVAVIGRPNVGKSSFVNRLLGEERLVVQRDRRDDARRDRHADDAITGGKLIFVDTAGLRRQTQDRRRHRVLFVAAHAARDRARRTSAS